MFEKLIESISTVSKEIQLLREEVKGNGNLMPKFALTGNGSENPNDSKREPISLDLEKFLKDRKHNRKVSS
jgi:hypothetical protein